jgi:hypothetical protein
MRFAGSRTGFAEARTPCAGTRTRPAAPGTRSAMLRTEYEEVELKEVVIDIYRKKQRAGAAYPFVGLYLTEPFTSPYPMKDNRLDAMLRRDENTAAGLAQDQPNYAGIEDDLGPLRTEHAANLTQAQTLEGAVLREDQDDSSKQKRGTRKQLISLGDRLAAALQAHAASAANSDPDLAGRVRINRTLLSAAEEGTLLGLIQALLKEAAPLTEALARREFTAADLSQLQALHQRFEAKQLRQRQSTVEGSTARKTLEALLRRNADLVKQLRVQLRPYKGTTKNEVWLRFEGYTKLLVRGGGGSTTNPAPTKAA